MRGITSPQSKLVHVKLIFSSRLSVNNSENDSFGYSVYLTLMFRAIFSTNWVAEQTSGDLGARVLPRFTAGHVYFLKLRFVLFNWYFGSPTLNSFHRQGSVIQWWAS